jgi:hypothetical protein
MQWSERHSAAIRAVQEFPPVTLFAGYIYKEIINYLCRGRFPRPVLLRIYGAMRCAVNSRFARRGSMHGCRTRAGGIIMTKFTAEEPDVGNDIINMAIQALDVLANKLDTRPQCRREAQR